MKGLKIKSPDFNDFTMLERDSNTLMSEVKAKLTGKRFFDQPLGTGHGKLILDYYDLLFDLIATKAPATHAGSTAWLTHCESARVQYAFIHHPEGFQQSGPSVQQLCPKESISLLIADSNYGVKKAAWDQVPWKEEFRDSIGFVLAHNRILDHAKFAWFVSDKQLVDCITACKDSGLNYKVITWAKPPSPLATGHRFRHDAEFIVLGWMGNEPDFVKNYNKNHPLRYSTIHNEARVSRPLKNSEGNPINPYQKPVNLMLKLINIACDSGESLIVDITCGTGTTAVSCTDPYKVSFSTVANYLNVHLYHYDRSRQPRPP
jgi:hypothetical protein